MPWAMRTLAAPLRSNGFALSTDEDRWGALRASDPAEPPGELAERLEADGYLWLQGLLDPEVVLDFRERYMAAHAPTGLLAPGTDPRAGIHGGGGEDKVAARRLSFEVVQWASYESLCLHPRLVAAFEGLLGGETRVLRRKLIRHFAPGSDAATGAHYDLTYLRAGTDRVLTAWIPIGDIDVEMGGLVYLEGSHAWGRATEAEFSRRNAELAPEERISAYNRNMAETGWLTKDLPSLSERLGTRWLGADYRAGDVVVHTAYTIHASTSNADPAGRLRLSTDVRYQRMSETVDERWSRDVTPDDNL
jgi:ectoine hydroxylase-related dioxygenase (phytanoyl-CoA dioxygenase family)